MSEPQLRFRRHPVDCGESCITGRFGDVYTVAGRTYRHRGVDYGVPIGTPVYAPAAGDVVPFTNDGSFGVGVCLRHKDGWFTLYAHLSRATVSIGQRVGTGDLIGYSGNTGLTTGPHLHWQLCAVSTFPVDISYSRDPLQYMEEGDAMADARDVIEELRRNKALRDALVALLLDEGPVHLELDTAKWDAWRRSLRVPDATGQVDVRRVLADISQRALGTPDIERGLAALRWRATAGPEWAEVLRLIDQLRQALARVAQRADPALSPPV
jgi:hypothetical protein